PGDGSPRDPGPRPAPADPPPHQAAGGSGSARTGRADALLRAAPKAAPAVRRDARLLSPGSRQADRRPGHGPRQVPGPRSAAPPAPGGLPSGAHRPWPGGRAVRQARAAAPPARRGSRRGAQGARLLPIHQLSRPAAPPARCRRAPLSVPRRQDQGPPGVRRQVPVRRLSALSDQPQGGRARSQSHRRRIRLPARSVVEPGRRGAGGRPRAPHRPGAHGLRLPARSPRHGGGKDPGIAEGQAHSRGCDRPSRREPDRPLDPGGSRAAVVVSIPPRAGRIPGRRRTQNRPFDEESLPADEESLPVDEESLPADEESLPVDEQSLPVDEESLPVDEESIPVDEESLPVDEESLPVGEESLPVDEESLPVDEESLPVDEESLPVGEESLPVDEESLPVDEEGDTPTFRWRRGLAPTAHRGGDTPGAGGLIHAATGVGPAATGGAYTATISTRSPMARKSSGLRV